MNSEEIYQKVKARIDGGKLAAGDKCPSESQLCAEFGVSRGTVRKACKRLAQEGYLEVSQGRQRTVRQPELQPQARLCLRLEQPLPLSKLRGISTDYTASFGEHLKRLGQDQGWEPTDDVLVSPSAVLCRELNAVARFDVPEIAEKLRIKTGRDKVIWFLRRRLGKNLPLVLQWVVVPARIIRQVDYDDLRPGGLTRLYREKYGIERAFAEAHYRPTLASREDARALRIERDTPLIEERRTSFYLPKDGNAKSGRELIPYEYLLSLYADRVSLDFSWREL